MLTNIFRTNFHFHKGISPELPLSLTSRKGVQPPTTVDDEEKKWPASYVEQMLSFNNMIWEGYKRAFKMADLPEGSYGLDAGCGPGGVLPLEALAVGHKGKILGLEYTPDHVKYAKEVKAAYLNGKYGQNLQVEVRWSDFTVKPLRYYMTDEKGVPVGERTIIKDHTFDWVWSSDTLCPGIFDYPETVFKELVRVTKPGGKIILFFGNDRTILLPGFQRLEAQLFEMTHFPDVDLKTGGSLMTQTDMANVWMAKQGLKVRFETLSVEKNGAVTEGKKTNPDHETPEWGDKTYPDFQLSQVFLNSLRDLHNGYNFPILDCTNKKYFPNSEDYYFRLLPQVNIGIVEK